MNYKWNFLAKSSLIDAQVYVQPLKLSIDSSVTNFPCKIEQLTLNWHLTIYSLIGAPYLSGNEIWLFCSSAAGSMD